jgi:hypothetical protein
MRSLWEGPPGPPPPPPPVIVIPPTLSQGGTYFGGVKRRHVDYELLALQEKEDLDDITDILSLYFGSIDP